MDAVGDQPVALCAFFALRSRARTDQRVFTLPPSKRIDIVRVAVRTRLQDPPARITSTSKASPATGALEAQRAMTRYLFRPCFERVFRESRTGTATTPLICFGWTRQ